ncbi:receptor-like protein cf-9, partial [Quercus suber]
VLFLLNWVSNGVFNLEVSSLLFVLFDLALSTSLSIIISLLPSLQCHHALLYSILVSLLPSSLFNLPNLSTLDLGYNQLVGPLPSHVSGLNLIFLSLGSNFLNGTLPSWLFSMPSLEGLYLNGYGGIPLALLNVIVGVGVSIRPKISSTLDGRLALYVA